MFVRARSLIGKYVFAVDKNSGLYKRAEALSAPCNNSGRNREKTTEPTFHLYVKCDIDLKITLYELLLTERI